MSSPVEVSTADRAAAGLRVPGRRRHRRRPLVVVVLVVLVVAGLLASLAVGSRGIGVGEVLRAVFTDLDSDNATVIRSQREPRTLLALVVGLALGAAGALMQGHTRNPLADPGLFGVNAGASFGVGLLVFALDVDDPRAVVAAALVGAALVSAVVFVLGLRGRSGNVVVLAVVGTAMGALLTALTTALVLLDRRTLDVLRFWEVGSVDRPDPDLWWLTMPLIAAGLAMALVNATSLSTLGLGDDVATMLGHHVRRSRLVGITALTLLAGAATAMCGPIAFLGLVAPHAVRTLSGHDYRWLVPMSALAGAVLLLVSDVVGRVVAPPGELQAGIVMAVVGGPVLLAITRRRRLVAL